MQRFPNMQMQSSFGRGFGGPPQPQRQGGRRGRGNFRGNGNNSRFDQPQQRHGQGSNNQRPSEVSNLCYFFNVIRYLFTSM